MKILWIFNLILVLSIIGLAQQKCSDKFKKEFLARHNELRAKHGVGPLKLDDSINKLSQQWADHLASTGSFQHSGRKGYGENLYMSWSSAGGKESAGSVPVQSWYNEIKDYTYFGREPDMKTFSLWGHFTQVIWKGSKQLGAGCAIKDGNFYVVGNYSPQGNIVGKGEFTNNVPAIKK